MRPAYQARFAEFVGTFVLVAIGPGAVMVAETTHAFGHQGVALAFGLIVAVVVASTGHLGGAHINPAVTIGLWSVGRFASREVFPYIAAQCLGAIGAALTLRWLLGPVGNLGATIPVISVGRAFAVEAGFSAVLALVIAGVVLDDRGPRLLAPLILGATIFVGALVTGPLTGGSFNPARSLGPAIAGGGWTAHWLYWIAPISGLTVGFRLYSWIGERTMDERARPLSP